MEGEEELKEKWVMILGGETLGKTTFVRKLRGEGRGESVVFEGIGEITQFKFGGVLFNCWEIEGSSFFPRPFFFANLIYIVVFDLNQSLPLIYSSLSSWVYSLSQVPSSQILLVGTHSTSVLPEKKQQVIEKIAQEFRGREEVEGGEGELREGGELLVVDWSTGEGMENVKKTLETLASQNLPRVPRFFVEIRQLFEGFCENHQEVAFMEANELKKELHKRKGGLEGLSLESWESFLRVSNDFGSVVLVDLDEYVGNCKISYTYVIFRLSWIVKKFKIMVGICQDIEKNGVVSIGALCKCWREEFKNSIEEIFWEALEKLGWVCRLSGRAKGEMIVPSLLPDSFPCNFSRWVQNGEEMRYCLVGCEEGNEVSSKVFRRSFLLKKEKESLPIGMIGKVLSSMFQWGEVSYAWKRGCVVVCGSGGDSIVVMMWEVSSGRRAGLHFIFYSEESLQSSCSLLREKNSLLMIRRLLQQTSLMMQNLFQDIYGVDYEAIIPCYFDSHGIPCDWVKIDDVFLAMHQNENENEVATVMKEGRNGGEEVSVGDWAPDLNLNNEGSLCFFEEDSIVFGEMLGKGAYGKVWAGEIRRVGGEENQRSAKKVAIKEILLDKWRKSLLETLKMVHRETYFSCLRHPNIMKMEGICARKSTPLLLFELLDGDLFGSLFDPLGLESILSKKFIPAMKFVFLRDKSWEEVLASSVGVQCSDFLKELRDILEKCPPYVQQIGEDFIVRTIDNVNERTISSNDRWEKSQAQLLDAYKLSFEEVAPLSIPGVLRIAADISRGLHYLHSHIPSLIHRDLKSPNIFLTRCLANGGGTKEYSSQNTLAKLGDLGLCSVVCGPYQLRTQGIMKEINPRWLAPEIQEGKEYSVESDVYSMGLTFWEIRYRETAFDDMFKDGVLNFVDKIKLEVPRGMRPKLSLNDGFDEIIKHCWCSSPSDRFSAEQTYSAIRSLSSSLAPSLYSNLPQLKDSSDTLTQP